MVLPLLAALALVQASGQVAAEHTIAWGVQHHQFVLNGSKLHVYLPDDMRAGDTISGIVVPDPVDPKKARGSDTLEGVVVEVGGSKVQTGRFLVTVGALGVMDMVLRNSDGKVIATTPVQVGPQSPPKTTLWSPPVAQAGKPITISGPFDGNAENTNCTLGGQPAIVLVESPRESVLQCLEDQPLGTTPLTVTENGTTTTRPVNVVNLNLSTPRTKLLRGDQGTIKITLTGLKGLPESAYPIPVEITNNTPAIIQLSKGGDCVCMPVNFQDVKNGAWNAQVTMTGVTPGTFALTGVCFAVNIHNLKMGLNADELGDIIGSQIASAEDLLSKKIAAKAPARTTDLIRKKIESLKLAKDALPDLDSARTTFDVAMASFTFFEMAGELIDFAADMLGYKDIPLPGLGEVLKGLKVVAKGTKAIETIEKIEKIKEGIDKITDAKEKLEKIQEAKDLLGKVKEELKGK